MPQPSNQKRTVSGAIMNASTDQINGYVDRVARFFQSVIARASQPVETQYRVAMQRLAEGEIEDAAMRLKLVVKFRPEHMEAWYNLGRCEMDLDEVEDAKECFRKVLAFKPDHEEARYLLTVLDPSALPVDQQPKFTPLSLATEHFDLEAPEYDMVQLDGLGYVGHQELFTSVQKFLHPDYKEYRIVDLGCGTGLVGLLFHEVAATLEGVDISQAMLDQAAMRRDEKERKVYSNLHLMDLRRFLLDQAPASVDLVLAGNVFPYVGGLTPVFDGAAHILKPGGMFAFCVEPAEGHDFILLPGQGRFGHSEYYITEHAKRVGLEVLEARPVDLYADLEGIQYVLRKPAAKQPAQPAAPQSPQS